MKEINGDFYKKTLRKDRQRSYGIICELLTEMYGQGLKVVDYGCGAGWILSYMHGFGASEVLGFEPNEDHKVIHHEFTDKIQHKSLSKEIYLEKDYDMAVSFEVVEHIPEEFAELAIENITRHTDLVVFSAAPPGQGGYGHINEQPWEYWERIFANYGFTVDASDTKHVCDVWKKKQIKQWYWKNTRILKRRV